MRVLRSHIVIVDDDPITRQILHHIVSILGHGCIETECAEDALAVLEVSSSLAVITDCAMPGMDGYTLAAAIRAREAQSNARPTRIIGHTASDDAATAMRCIDAGMNVCLVKPATTQQVAHALGNLVLAQDTCHRNVFPMALAQQVADHVLRDLANIYHSVSIQEWTLAHKQAHRLRGASALVGMERVSAACALVEQATAREDAAGAHAALISAERAFRTIPNT